MFDFVRTRTRLMQFLLVLLIFPSFVFFGIQGYSRFTSSENETVARVAGENVTRGEWDAAYRQHVERLRREMPALDAKLFDSPAFKREVLDQLVRDRTLEAAVEKLNLATGDRRLQRLFAEDPRFEHLRNSDGSIKKELAQSMSLEQLEHQLRREFTQRQVLLGIAGSALAPRSLAERAFDAVFQRREAQVRRFSTDDYKAKVEITDEEIVAYYNDASNRARFMAPETADIEYVVLDLESLKKGITVSEDDLRKYHAENATRFGEPEERRASHILFQVDKSAPADESAKVKARAQDVLEQLRKEPKSFAELAKKHSGDPGSAARGGDLDFFGRGAMVKPFEDAVFALKRGELSGLVETEFGYHIIRLDDVRGGAKKPFEAVRAQVEDEVRNQLARARYAEAAEQFTNLVYEQSDSLKPAAERLKLQIQTAQVQRARTSAAPGPLATEKFIEALFGDDALKNKRNTEAVEVGPNQLASGRIVKHTPQQQIPLDRVRAQVRELLVARKAAEMARKEGEALLAALRAGQDAPPLPPAETISRASAGKVSEPIIEAVLQADPGKLPALSGVPLGDAGYAVVRVTKILDRDPASFDAARTQAQYAQLWSQAETQAYLSALKTRYRVEVTAAENQAPAADAGNR